VDRDGREEVAPLERVQVRVTTARTVASRARNVPEQRDLPEVIAGARGGRASPARISNSPSATM
jgi:hypothetical protein